MSVKLSTITLSKTASSGRSTACTGPACTPAGRCSLLGKAQEAGGGAASGKGMTAASGCCTGEACTAVDAYTATATAAAADALGISQDQADEGYAEPALLAFAS